MFVRTTVYEVYGQSDVNIIQFYTDACIVNNRYMMNVSFLVRNYIS